jgi:YggT family protein
MLKPFVDLICDIISLIELALAIWIILELLINFDIVNRASPIVNNLYNTLSRLLEPLLRPIRNAIGKYLTHFGGMDLSPIILWLLLRFLRNALISWFYIEPLMNNTVTK